MNTETYSFEIIQKSWAKRRKVTLEPQPIFVTSDDFKLQEQHFSTMQLSFGDGSQQDYLSRVLPNHISAQWTVDGMHIAVKVLMSE